MLFSQFDDASDNDGCNQHSLHCEKIDKGKHIVKMSNDFKFFQLHKAVTMIAATGQLGFLGSWGSWAVGVSGHHRNQQGLAHKKQNERLLFSLSFDVEHMSVSASTASQSPPAEDTFASVAAAYPLH